MERCTTSCSMQDGTYELQGYSNDEKSNSEQSTRPIEFYPVMSAASCIIVYCSPKTCLFKRDVLKAKPIIGCLNSYWKRG